MCFADFHPCFYGVFPFLPQLYHLCSVDPMLSSAFLQASTVAIMHARQMLTPL